MTQTIENQMLWRYSQCVLAHPGCALVAACKPLRDEEVPLVAGGRLTHVLYSKGELLIIAWVESSTVQFLFDAYA